MKSVAGRQLEFGINGRRQEMVNLRQQRLKRAQWWFGKMRQVVDLAMPPQAAHVPPPEQTFFELNKTA